MKNNVTRNSSAWDSDRSIVHIYLQRAMDDIQHREKTLKESIKREQLTVKYSKESIDKNQKELDILVLDREEIQQTADTLGVTFEVEDSY